MVSLNAAIGVADAQTRAATVSVEQTLIPRRSTVVLTKNANVGDIITPFSSAADSKGRGGDDGRHEHAGSGGGRDRSQHRQGGGGRPCEITLDALPEGAAAGRGVAHRADGGPGQGDRAGEGGVCRARSAPCPT